MSQSVLRVGKSLSEKRRKKNFPWLSTANEDERKKRATHLLAQPHLPRYDRDHVHFNDEENGIEEEAGEDLVSDHDCARGEGGGTPGAPEMVRLSAWVHSLWGGVGDVEGLFRTRTRLHPPTSKPQAEMFHSRFLEFPEWTRRTPIITLLSPSGNRLWNFFNHCFCFFLFVFFGSFN